MMPLYSEKTVEFLWELRFNNSREWFHAHKEAFDKWMLCPTKALADALFDHLCQKAPGHDWNLHLSRIYRDARRLHGRGPMNDHLWFTLWADREEDSAPAFWFSFFPEGWDFGMGCWSEHRGVMERFRAQLSRDCTAAEELARRLQTQDVFSLGGDCYKRPKLTTTPLLQPWADRKTLLLICRRDHGELDCSEALFPFVRDGLDFLMPYYEYFLRLPALDQAKSTFNHT